MMPIVTSMIMDPHPDTPDWHDWTPLPAAPDERRSSFFLSRRRINNWSLVLEARGIPSRTVRYGLGWHLLVPEQLFDQAIAEVSLYETENRNWPPLPPPPNPLVENTLATVSALLLLATFHNIVLIRTPFFGYPPPDWLDIGSARASRILDGEWWRLVTALTLHSDSVHLLGNLAIGGLFIVFLCREMGSGLAWSMLIASGALGNLANAWFHLPTHTSVGASTMVFGGVGLLSAINMIRYRHHPKKMMLVPIAGALALLASLGTEGANTDLGAHLFGFAFGLALGGVAGHLLERHHRPGKRVNILLSLLCGMVVILSWCAAVRYSI